jgi:Tfp pilus assembly protein PilF
MTMRRAVLSVLFASSLAACNTVSSENEGLLSNYLQNAAQYYDGGHFLRAYQQWEQALEIESDNEKARLGQVMALYQMGRVESVEAIKPLTEATKRVDELQNEDFDRDQWKVELAVALVHLRWCDIYDRKLRRIAEEERKGVAPDKKTQEIARREFEMHMDVSEKALHKAIAGPEREPRDRLTCWLGLARIAAWRDDLEASLKYSNLYLEQIVKSKNLWKDSAERFPRDAPIYEAKFGGAQMQEADLRDLMGAVLFRLGRTDEAEKELNLVISMFPQRANAYLNRGILRQMRGEDDLARSDFKKFLSYTELPENDPSILEASRRLVEVGARLAAQDARDREPGPPR